MQAAVRTGASQRDRYRRCWTGYPGRVLRRSETREEHVPRIIVMADSATDTVMLSERIGVADLDSEHFRAQLLERLSWAVGDAHAAEQADREE